MIRSPGEPKKPVILTFVHYYLPAYKSGGPVRTISNLVAQLADEFEFLIVTTDRDALDDKPFEGARVDNWNELRRAHVFYASKRYQRWSATARLLRNTAHDVLYLNSLFDPVSTIRPLLARRLGLTPHKPLVVAPRGEFSRGALGLKSPKKRAYIALAKVLGLYRDAIWQASSSYEAQDISRVMGVRPERIQVAPDLPSAPAPSDAFSTRTQDAPVRVIFLSRIDPMKNLDYALEVLAGVDVPVAFDIVGPIRNAAYWGACESLIEAMPERVTVRYLGDVKPHLVSSVMANYDLFLMPTRGENFGHVIAESLGAGTPVLISDRTPWRDLEQAGVGWDISLDDKSVFVDRIEEVYAMDREAYLAFRARTRRYAEERLQDPANVEANRLLFLRALGRAEAAPDSLLEA